MVLAVRLWLQLNSSILKQALLLALAAWLSFSIAVLLRIENAYWAAMPVWVISQSTRGLLLGRALYRILGSLAGAGLGFLILHLPVDLPIQLCLAALAIGITAGACHVLPGVRSYVALVSAVTIAVVVVPSALDTEHSFILAVERVECTLIGVIVTTLVMAFWTPPSARQEFYVSVRRASADTLAMASDALGLGRAYEPDGREQRILGELCELESKSFPMAASSPDGYRRQHHVTALIASSLEVAAGSAALLAEIQRGYQLPRDIPLYLAEAAKYLSASGSDRPAAPADYPVETLAQEQHPALVRLMTAVGALIKAEQALFSASDAAPETDLQHRPLIDTPKDWASAWQTAATTGFVSLFASGLIYVTASPTAVPMAMAVSIFSIILGSFQQPQKMAPIIFSGVVFGLLAAIVYRIWLQPWADTPTLLILSVLPFIVAGAVARAHPLTAMAAVDANMGFLLVSQAGRSAVLLDVILLEALATLIGSGLIIAAFYLLPRLPHRRAVAAVRDMVRDLERLLRPPSLHVHQTRWRSASRRKIMSLTLHLRRAGRLDDEIPGSLMAVLNLGHAIALLQHHAALRNHESFRALKVLRVFRKKPDEVMSMLGKLMQDSTDREVRTALQMTVDALSRCKLLFEFSDQRRGR